MALRYDPLLNDFLIFEVAENPVVTLNLPLIDDPIDISDWSENITPSGNIIVKSNLPQMTDSRSSYRVEDSPIENISTDLENNDMSNLKSTGTRRLAVDFFINKGLSPTISKAIVGNLIHESGLKTSASGDKGSALGLALWRLDRLTGLKNFAKSQGKSHLDFDTLLEWVWQELNSSYKEVLNNMKKTTTLGDATRIFMDQYERPNKKYAHFSSRLKHAESL